MLTLIAQSRQVIDIAGKASSISPISSVGRLVEMGAGAILAIGGLAFFMYLLLGGFHWITAGGDKSKVENARSMITQGIIGLAILASVFAVYSVVLRFLGIQSIDVGQGGTGASTSQCSDWCTLPTECTDAGGKQVARMCTYQSCNKGLIPCTL